MRIKDDLSMMEFRLTAWTTFLLFLGLKISGVVDWGWWIVTIPLWLPLLIVLVIAFVAGFFFSKG